MNRSDQNTSNSPGFVYFNTNSNQEYQNKSDSADYLAFNDSPQTHRFKPAHYSSPQSRYYRGSPRNYPQNNRRYQRWYGGNRSTNNSSGSNYSNNSSARDNEGEPNISRYVHPSFLEDPWKELEAKLKQKRHECESTQGQNT